MAAADSAVVLGTDPRAVDSFLLPFLRQIRGALVLTGAI